MVATSFVTNYSLIHDYKEIITNEKAMMMIRLLPTNYLPIYVIDKNMFNDAIYLHINQTETWTEKSCTIIVMMFSYFKLLDNQFLLLSKSVHD